jgi:hypothetical protein
LLTAVIIILLIKIYLMKKSAREIKTGFAERLTADTNTLIGISSGDGDMCELAESLNEQLRQLRSERRRFLQGDRELKNAVTNISHDLRTPLTAVCGYLDMAERTEDIEKIKRYLAIISERTETMKRLTEELFRYSVILSDDGDFETEDVLVNKLLEDSIMGYYGALSERKIVPQVRITDRKIIKRLNEAYVSRIFSNLLNNALKYSDGDLDIELSDEGKITFANTARNISAVQAEQLFDRFYTVEAARNSTGIGLSIARKLVERMGGTIKAEYVNDRLLIIVWFE